MVWVKNMKNDKKVIAILICTAFILGTIYFIKNHINNSDDEFNNIMIKNGRYLYLYVVDKNNESLVGKLLQVSTDGRKIKLLKTCGYVRNFSIYKKKLYYIDSNLTGVPQINRIGLDGSKYETLYYGGVDNFYIDKEHQKIFYGVVNGEGTSIYSSNLDFKNEKLVISKASYWSVYQGKIYGSFRLGDISYEVKEFNSSGKLLRKVCDIENSLFSIREGSIFYNTTNYSEMGLKNNIEFAMYSVNIKTGNKRKIIKDNISYFVIKKDKIYYSTVKDVKSILDNSLNIEHYQDYSCSLDGSSSEKINQEMIIQMEESYVSGNYIYYPSAINRDIMRKNITNNKEEILIPYDKLLNAK